MALDDIVLYEGPLIGIENGAVAPSDIPLASSSTFSRGEPVVFNGSGYVGDASTDPAAVAGIAMTNAQWPDGTSHVQGYGVRVRPLLKNIWYCDNFATDGAATSATPTVANAIGQLAGFTATGGSWYIDTGAANLLLLIETVLDANGIPITNPGGAGTGTRVLFRGI